MDRTPLAVMLVAAAQAFIEYVIWKVFRLPPITRRQRVFMFLGWAVPYTAWYIYQHGWEQVLDFTVWMNAMMGLGAMALIIWSLAYAPHGESRKSSNM